MELSRRLQGRLHDVNMNMASHAARVTPSNPTEKSTYTVSSRQILELMSRYTRLFNLLTYASFTRSHRPILTPRGLRRLVERGLMTATELDVLVDAVIPATQRHSVVLMWMIRLFIEGRESGHIQGGHGFESETMHKFHIIRSQYGAIGDELQGRMPLAYAHIVQVLVDLILWMFPFMAFSTGTSPLLVVVGTGLLTMSYQGLFDLAKQFLDPYDNESYGRGEDPLCVDTLIAETNAGSIRWLYGFEELPFSAQRLADGELYEYLLPVRGYSIKELEQMEEEKVEREKQLEEHRKREESETAATSLEGQKEMEEAEIYEMTEAKDVNNEKEINSKIDSERSPPKSETIIITRIPSSDVTTGINASSTQESSTELEEKILSSPNETHRNFNSSSNLVIEDPPDNNFTNSTKVSGSIEESKPVHTVTTLATDGSLISSSSFKPTETIKPIREEPVPTGMQTSNYLASLKQKDEFKLLHDIDLDKDDFTPEIVQFESDDGLWSEEFVSDNEELSLSKQLANENWVEIEEIKNVENDNTTLMESGEAVQKIEDNVESDLQKTIEILTAFPDAEIYTTDTSKEKKVLLYGQNQRNSIAQLWGLPSEDPSTLMSDCEPPEHIGEVDFRFVSQLWGDEDGEEKRNIDASNTSIKNKGRDEDETVGLGSLSAISELVGSTNNLQYDNSENRHLDIASMNETVIVEGESEHNEDTTDGMENFAGVPWHDEKESRLSEMLADEEWSLESDADEASSMSIEDYNKQVKEIITQAEEEFRETEAILLSKPGTDPIGWDYDDEQLTPMSNISNTEETDENEEEEEIRIEDEIGNQTLVEDEDLDGDLDGDLDADLAVLEMDVDLDIDLVTGIEEGTKMLSDNDENIQDYSDNESSQELEKTSKQSPEKETNTDDITDTDSGKDKIQPIFLEGNSNDCIDDELPCDEGID